MVSLNRNHTFNPWRGCIVASESMWNQPLKWNQAAGLAADMWEAIGGDKSNPGTILHQGVNCRWHRPRVFCASLADVFEDWDKCPTYSDGSAVIYCNSCGHWGKNGSTGDGNCCEKCDSGAVEMASLNHVRKRLFDLIDATPNLDWLLVTNPNFGV